MKNANIFQKCFPPICYGDSSLAYIGKPYIIKKCVISAPLAAPEIMIISKQVSQALYK